MFGGAVGFLARFALFVVGCRSVCFAKLHLRVVANESHNYQSILSIKLFKIFPALSGSTTSRANARCFTALNWRPFCLDINYLRQTMSESRQAASGDSPGQLPTSGAFGAALQVPDHFRR